MIGLLVPVREAGALLPHGLDEVQEDQWSSDPLEPPVGQTLERSCKTKRFANNPNHSISRNARSADLMPCLRYKAERFGKIHGWSDLFLPERRAVFVHGCFWHRHEGCRYATTPSTRTGFWQAKLEANIARESADGCELLSAGWRVATIWEYALRKHGHVAAAVYQPSTWLLIETEMLELGEQEVRFPNDYKNDVSSPDWLIQRSKTMKPQSNVRSWFPLDIAALGNMEAV